MADAQGEPTKVQGSMFDALGMVDRLQKSMPALLAIRAKQEPDKQQLSDIVAAGNEPAACFARNLLAIGEAVDVVVRAVQGT